MAETPPQDYYGLAAIEVDDTIYFSADQLIEYLRANVKRLSAPLEDRMDEEMSAEDAIRVGQVVALETIAEILSNAMSDPRKIQA